MNGAPSEDRAFNWDLGLHAISFESFGAATDPRRPTIVVSHPTAPFLRPLAGGEVWSEQLMGRTAHAYLVRLNSHLAKRGHSEGIGLPTGWLDALDPSRPGGNFGWLPIAPPLGKSVDDHAARRGVSHRLVRRRLDDGVPDDETVILVAGDRWHHNGTLNSTGSGFGLRVVLHLRESSDDRAISICAMTAHLPYTPYVMMDEVFKDSAQRAAVEFLIGPTDVRDFLERGAPQIAEMLHLAHSEVDGLIFDEFRFFRHPRSADDKLEIGLEVAGLGASELSADQKTSYRFRARLRRKEGELVVESMTRRAMVTGVSARVFEQEPASWREPARPPSRGAHDALWGTTRVTRDLDRFRIDVTVPAQLESQYGDFLVRNCPRFVRSDPHNSGPRKIEARPGGHPVRSDDQSAVGAYHNFRNIFEVIRGLGLVPELYFRACQLPVSVFYRSGIRPGPGKNGRTINAWVRLRKPETKGLALGVRPRIEVHLALANLSRRWHDPDRPGPRWAEPLGIAASERWILHEFGHVLIAAACGSDPPEFRFAHSVGDGLAAVWADPMSRHANQQRPVEARLRGYTFPWVFAARRHDRRAGSGWSWSGTLQRPVSEASEAALENYKSYLSEQTLSSTLFRLYRCLGGDTLTYDRQQPDLKRRRAASHIVLYLVMRAIESFGHVPLRAEELEAAMIDADVGLTTPLRDSMNRSVKLWVGGRAHKVVRWAFEAQGMHPPQPGAIHDAAGAPPPVDIYVSDRRSKETLIPDGAIDDPGGYRPVSLDWSVAASWFAENEPRIGNRGNQPATDIRVRIWIGILQLTSPPPDEWIARPNIRWISETAQQLADLAGGEARALALPSELPPEGEGQEALVLIELSCADDRANTDPLAGLPTAVARIADLPKEPGKLADLVATDNNLGLWRQSLTAMV